MGEKGMKKVGFIGLGTMGKGMAHNIRQAGFDLCVFDIDQEAVDLYVLAGAKAADSPKAAAEYSDGVLTMLPDVPQVEEVYLGEMGLLESNGHQNYVNWKDLVSYHPYPDGSWINSKNGVFNLNNEFYEKSGGVLAESEHYNGLFQDKH